MLIAVCLTLAGGVSLGPENPVIGTDIALAVALGVRVLGRPSTRLWMGMAAAGTIGAINVTPVSALC